MGLVKILEVNKEKCVNCHRCISVCPVKFCNNGAGEYVTVNESLCIGCGECIEHCPHDARKPVDDFQSAMTALQRKERVVAIVAPAIAAIFPKTYLQFNGWLKSIGIDAIFDVSFGAELTIKSYLEIIKNKKPKTLIAQPCPAIVNFIEIFHPELIKYLAPADSPMMHTIKMVKQFYPQYSHHKVFVVSPCTAKRREFDEVGLGDFNVTIGSIREYFSVNSINLEHYPRTEFDNAPAERAVLFSTPGGLLRTAHREVPDIETSARKIEGPQTIYHYLANLEQSIQNGKSPLIVDCLNCECGCNGGTAVGKKGTMDEIEFNVEQRNKEMQAAYKQKGILRNSFGAKQRINKVINQYWRQGLYDRSYKNRSLLGSEHNFTIPDKAVIAKIFTTMLKDSQQDILDCGACGYRNCEEMAIAIANGLNKRENCHVFVNKNFHNTITEIMGKMEKLAAGDLTIQMEGSADPQIQQLWDRYNKVAHTLSELIHSLTGLILTAANSTEQISASVEEMAAGAREQTAQTMEVSTAIEEMTQSIFENSKNTTDAADTAKKAGKKAHEGNEVVNDTIAGINTIAKVVRDSAETVFALGKNSEQIGEIVQVIDDIANQTNLLALNAAIEAARAGEQGRGFAVVADEVRKLAERTTKATREISEMIKQIRHDTENAVIAMKRGTSEVEKGKNSAGKAGIVLREIMEGAEKVTDIVTQVAAASEQQSSTADEISKNIEKINAVTSETSSGIQQVANSTDSLLSMTRELKELVAHFRTDKNTAAYEKHMIKKK